MESLSKSKAGISWRNHTVHIPDLKMTYIAIPRSANTSMKLALAEQMGFTEASFIESEWPHATAAQGVHNEHLAPWGSLDAIDGSEFWGAVRSPGWFTFTVVRDPVVRIWSAWQLLVLLEDPHLAAMGRPHSCGVDLESCEPRDVVAAFTEFIASAEFDELSRIDTHFMSQAALLDGAPTQTRFYALERISELECDLEEHFARLDLAPPILRKRNTSVLQHRELDFSDFNPQAIFNKYSWDYEKFGYGQVNTLSGQSSVEVANQSLLRALGQLRERNRRILQIWKSHA